MSLEKYIDQLEKDYIDGISYSKFQERKETSGQVPVQLEELYKKYNGMVFPFGMIYPIEKALEMSSRSPFLEEKWFCFGQDCFFSYLLCKKNTAEENCAFSIWDHEVEAVIEEPAFQSLEEVLEYLAKEYNSSDLDKCNVVIKECDEHGLKELMQAKKIFSSKISISEMKQKVLAGGCIIKNYVNIYEAKRILAQYTFEHIFISIERID